MSADDTIQGDMKAHENTYLNFLGLLKYGTAISFIVTMIVIFLIAG